MKRLIILISILALAFTACPTDTDDNQTTLTINDLHLLPSGGDGYAVYVCAIGTDVSTTQAANAANDNQVYEAFGVINSGNVFPLWPITYTDGKRDETSGKWTKSGNFPVILYCDGFGPYYATVNFSNGNGTTQSSSFSLCQ